MPWWYSGFIITAAYVNSAANPLLYAIFNQRFRSKFKQLLTCGCFQSERQRRQELLRQQRTGLFNCTMTSFRKKGAFGLYRNSNSNTSSPPMVAKSVCIHSIARCKNDEEKISDGVTRGKSAKSSLQRTSSYENNVVGGTSGKCKAKLEGRRSKEGGDQEKMKMK